MRAPPVRSRLHVGTSGWVYDDWVGRFYPRDLPQRGWLAHYQRHFDAVELNVTFYRLPRETVFDGWAARAPRGFRFAVKGPRLVTHLLRLRNAADATGTFLSRIRRLGDRLGPILWQLPPGLSRDEERLAAFLDLLPRDLSHAFEFRHESWFAEPVYRLLREHGGAMVVWHAPDRASPVVATTDTVYLRFHGTAGWYGGGYGRARLAGWAARARAWLAEGREVWAFFNNDIAGHAVRDALALRGMVAGAPPGAGRSRISAPSRRRSAAPRPAPTRSPSAPSRPTRRPRRAT